MSEMLVCSDCGVSISKDAYVKLVGQDNPLVSSDDVVAELRSFSPYLRCHSPGCRGVLHEET